MIQCSPCGMENRNRAQHCVGCGAPLGSEPVVHGAALTPDRQVRLPIVSAILGVLCFIYLLNPTAGVVELIPDNLPIVGNLDEGAAGMILLQMLYNLRVLAPGKRGKTQ